jgi:Uma2 family endonuclease
VLTNLLVPQVKGRFRVRPQLPLTLGERSEPEPDLAVVPIPATGTTAGNRRAALLVIEVAGESLRQDRLVKARIYARAGIPEYWIVDLQGRSVEIQRAPDVAAGAYRTSLKAVRGEALRSSAVEGVEVNVAELFG